MNVELADKRQTLDAAEDGSEPNKEAKSFSDPLLLQHASHSMLRPSSPVPQPPCDIPGAMIQGLFPPAPAESMLTTGMGGMPSSQGLTGMLGALTHNPAVLGFSAGSALVALARVGEGGPTGGLKDNKAAVPATSTRDGKKRARTDGKDEQVKDGRKKMREDQDKAEDSGADDKEGSSSQKLCPHNKPKATCMQCTGCPHGKRRQNCKECNSGSRQWCQHGKRKHDCHECSGCPHGRIKRSCKDCNGSGICSHGKLKRSCRDCSTDMCEHKRRRYYCRDCQGAGACEHNNRRWRCRECNGMYTCEHGLIRTNCLQCEILKVAVPPSTGEGSAKGGGAPRDVGVKVASAVLGTLSADKKKGDSDSDALSTQQQDHQVLPLLSHSMPDVVRAASFPSITRETSRLEVAGMCDIDTGLGSVAAGGAASFSCLLSPPPPPVIHTQLNSNLSPDMKDRELGATPLFPLAHTADPALDAVAVAAAGAAAAASLAAAAAAAASFPAGLQEKPGLVELEDQEAEEARAKAESGVSRVCMHQRWRIFCAECGGSGLCPHGKRKGTCKTCGGTQFCEHKRLRRQCRVCRPELKAQKASMCPHNKRKSRCRLCGGSQFCSHGKNKDWCKECGGRRLCAHQRQKHQCRECCALGLCPHKKPDQCVGKTGKGKGRPRIHPEKPKGEGSRRGRPSKGREGDGREGGLLALGGVAMGNSCNSSSEFRALEGAASSIALTPCMSSLQAASTAAAMAMDATAAVECAGSSGDTVAGVKDGVPGQQQVGVRKDKVLRARPMRPKRPASEGDGQSSEPVLCSEGVDPLYALSVHAVSASAKEKAEKEGQKKDGAGGKEGGEAAGVGGKEK